MSSTIGTRVGAVALAIALIVVACEKDNHPLTPREKDPASSDPMFTMSTAMSTLLSRATFTQDKHKNIDIKRQTDDWRVQIKSKSAFDMAVQNIVFQPGTQSGWHTHPGPVFIQVVSGTMTFYQSDDPKCTPIVRKAGEGFIDLGEHPHIARNETTLPAQNIVVYFAPPGAALRIDQPKPGNCAF